MYVDASAMCNRVAFDLGSGATDSRSWDIKVTQYECGHAMAGKHCFFDGRDTVIMDLWCKISGPPDCLQYHTGTSGAAVRRYDTFYLKQST